MEPILSHTEHVRKCLKVEYLGRIDYDFQKSRVTGSSDHMVSVSAKKFKKKFHACVPLILKTLFCFSWSLRKVEMFQSIYIGWSMFKLSSYHRTLFFCSLVFVLSSIKV
jgi:hypothetical protein